MSTEAQINANRENARKSTGPRTEEGKQISSRNAVRHGLSGRIGLLTDEDRLLYAARHERLIREMQPVTLVEEDLVHTIADSQWQINQYRVYDQQVRQDLQIEEAGLTAAQAIRKDLETKNVLDKLARYLALHTRNLYQAIREFDLRKKTRLAAVRAEAIQEYEAQTGTVFNPKNHGVTVPNGFDLQHCLPFVILEAIRAEIRERQPAPEPVPMPQAA